MLNDFSRKIQHTIIKYIVGPNIFGNNFEQKHSWKYFVQIALDIAYEIQKLG